MSLFEPSEPREPIHSKSYERGMAVLTIRLSVAACSLAVVALSGPWDNFVWALGLMFGINLLMWGLALVIIGLAGRSTAAGI